MCVNYGMQSLVNHVVLEHVQVLRCFKIVQIFYTILKTQQQDRDSVIIGV